MRIGQDRVLGAACAVLGLAIIFIWIPLDVESGVIEKIRSRRAIGDAMAPSIAAALLILAGLLLLFGARSTVQRLSLGNVYYIGALLLLALLVFLIMRWAGPLLVWLFSFFDPQPQLSGYRALRDSVPWKYAGYLSGGTLLLFALISFAEHRCRCSRLLLSAAICLLVALFYDLPFDDLLLPPNGDA